MDEQKPDAKPSFDINLNPDNISAPKTQETINPNPLNTGDGTPQAILKPQASTVTPSDEPHEMKMENLAGTDSTAAPAMDDQKASSVKKYIVSGLIAILILAGGFAAYLFYFKNLLNTDDSTTETTSLDEGQSTNTLSGSTQGDSENSQDPEKMDEIINDLSQVYTQETKPQEEKKEPQETAPTIDFSGLPEDDEVFEEEDVIEEEEVVEQQQQEPAVDEQDASNKVMR